MWQGIFICATATAALLVWSGVRLIPESTPVARGTTFAYSGGCIDCHGQPGDALSDDAPLECTDENPEPTHPRYAGSCRDVLAYFEAVRLKRTFSERVTSPNQNRLLQGERLARKYNCFQCHGELGQGGFGNRGALKGYVPGYFGKDFAALTRGGHVDSVRAWIRLGVDRALFEYPVEGAIARYFIERQAVGMPKFVTLPDAEIQILAEYVITLNKFGEMDARALRAYGRLTQRNQ